MKQFLPILILSILFSCNKVDISKIEINAVDKVLQFYSGEINRSIGFQTKNTKKLNYFELKVSKSHLLNKDLQHLGEHAGNIAYLFYSNLGNEQKNYDEIRVIIDLENGESRSYKFLNSELKEIENLYPTIEQTNNFINKSDYKSLANQMSKTVGTKEIEIKKLFENIHSKHGAPDQIQFQGFSFAKDSVVGNYIFVKEAIILTKNTGAMYLSYDRKTKELIGINFP